MEKRWSKEEDSRGTYSKMVHAGADTKDEVFESCPHGQAATGREEEAPGVGVGEKEEIETRCGLGQCRPALLQRLNNPKVLCFCLCAYTLVQGNYMSKTANADLSLRYSQ